MTELHTNTIVIAGASSGIGRATALAFAREGARLVLAARRGEVLAELANECSRIGEPLGAQAISVPTDVTDATAVQRLASAALERFGGIDVWINNAGVGAVGHFEEIPIETHVRVIQTNLIGHLHGAHAVLPHFKRKGRGILINTVSIGGWLASPYAVAYSASKFGLRGFSEALRAELEPFPEIHVCDVFPAFIDTPGFQHGANYFGREIKPVPPVYPAERVAAAMLSVAKRPRAVVSVGAPALAARPVHALLGDRASRALGWFMRRYLERAPAAPRGDGSLFESRSREAAVSGGWR
jgi:NAD(P)-dependent dehydrogenase (short-subunit alcohol dehydrogenase family)